MHVAPDVIERITRIRAGNPPFFFTDLAVFKDHAEMEPGNLALLLFEILQKPIPNVTGNQGCGHHHGIVHHLKGCVAGHP